MLRLIPHETGLFETFNRAAENVLEGAGVLVAVLHDPTDFDAKVRHLKEIEHIGDELTHAIA